jgi:hypothetical protein
MLIHPPPSRRTVRKKPPLGDRLSAAIVRVTGAQPCGTCHQIRKAVNVVEQSVKNFMGG